MLLCVSKGPLLQLPEVNTPHSDPFHPCDGVLRTTRLLWLLRLPCPLLPEEPGLLECRCRHTVCFMGRGVLFDTTDRRLARGQVLGPIQDDPRVLRHLRDRPGTDCEWLFSRHHQPRAGLSSHVRDRFGHGRHQGFVIFCFFLFHSFFPRSPTSPPSERISSTRTILETRERRNPSSTISIGQ